jgi:hypothetical protein
MKSLVLAATAALAAATAIEPADAWMRAGGGFGGGWGHTAGGGVYHTGDAGGYWHGSAANGSGAAHASTYGGYYHGTYANGAGAWHTGAYGDYYHQPAVVNSYGGGCWNCGNGGWGYAGAAAAGAVAGAAVGAAVTAAAIGRTYGYLPSGCVYSPFNGAAYYSCGGYWVRPAYGANGVYYTVVPAP